MTELRPFKNADGKIVKYKPGHVGFKVDKMADLMGAAHKETTKVNVIEQYLLRYSEKPKIVFLVTPPHLMKYAKLLLILITQLVNLNFEQSYMTKESQKPSGF